jgi:hypothetical protein
MKRENKMKIVTKFICSPLMGVALAWCALSASAPQSLAADGGGPLNNTSEGTGALAHITNGSDNTGIGFNALNADQSGSFNTAVGSRALANNLTPAGGVGGGNNTAVGFDALVTNMGGSDNTATGSGALSGNQIGNDNTATGHGALGNNANGSDNTAVGSFALELNQAGVNNTATGEAALLNNTASNNTATGFQALFTNKTGTQNTAIGVSALLNSIASNNTATGFRALLNNKGNGQSNTANGAFALQNNTTGSSNIALGFQAGANLTTGSKNIDIGNVGVAGEGNTIRIGTEVTSPFSSSATFIAHIYGQTVDGASGLPVFIDNSGHLGTVQSSARFKDDVKPMDSASEALLKLKPVTFRYKQQVDSSGVPQFGLIAEQVEKVAPELVVRDKGGKPYSVRYEAVNAMLLNEFLKEHRLVQEQRATINELKSAIAKREVAGAQQQEEIKALAASLKEQALQIQKVNTQLELNKPAPQIVVNNR